MRGKKKIIIILGCLLTLVSMCLVLPVSAEVEQPQQSQQVHVHAEPAVYHADANGPYSGSVNQQITFTSAGTSLNNIVSYEWNFGDDTPLGYGKTPTHFYKASGDYIVTLTVKNNLGVIYKDITRAYIDKTDSKHLFPDGKCFYSANVNEVLEFDGSSSYSSGAEIVEYLWDFGDGTTSLGKIVTHSYSTARVYLVTLKTTDSEGNWRRDILHADIGMPYSNDNNFYANAGMGQELLQVLNYLLESGNWKTGILCGIFEAKIYTNFNGYEKITPLEGLNPLPLEINVNDQGNKDIKVNQLTFFKEEWAPSLFEDNDYKEWHQFLTELANVNLISGGDITNDVDFTICLQLDLSIMAGSQFGFLDLQDPIMRIGYHSEKGQVKPNTITVQHILRPYIWQRFWNGINENWYPGYWPEYGVRVNQDSSGSFSLFTMFLNEEQNAQSKTTLQCTFAGGKSNLMYKRTKTGGLLNHKSVLNIPAESSLRFSAIRETSSSRTELSTGFSYTGNLIRGFGWSDQGINVEFLGKSVVSFTDFYFDNPDSTFSAGEVSFGGEGGIILNFDSDNAKLTLDGFGLGFKISNMLFKLKKSNFEAELIGTLDLESSSSISISLAAGEIGFGFDNGITLNSDCQIRVNDNFVTIGGEFGVNGHAEIAITWGDNEFAINLDTGVLFEINNLNFEVGQLTANATLIEIGASGGTFGLTWDAVNSEVTISGGAGVSLGLTDLEITYGSVLNVKVVGSFEVQANGDITFAPGLFKTSFVGTLDLGAFCEFIINEVSIKVGGAFTILETVGELEFTWDDEGFNLNVDSGSELTIDNFLFKVGDLTVSSDDEIIVGANGQLNIDWNSATQEVTISTGEEYYSQGMPEPDITPSPPSGGSSGSSSGVNSDGTSGNDGYAPLGRGDILLSVTNLNINYGTIIEIQIKGTFEFAGEGYLTFSPGIFKAGFTGSLDLGGSCNFEINGQNIFVGGVFSLESGSGEIEFSWSNEDFNLAFSGASELSVEDLYFEVGALKVTADNVGIGVGGELNIEWNTGTSEITVSSGDVSLSTTNLYIKYSTVLTVQIQGSLTIQANGYVTFAPGVLEAGFTGSLNLGTGGASCEFIINGNSIKAGGLFTLSGGFGEITFSWGNNQFSLGVSGNPSLDVTDLYFEATISSQIFKVDATDVGIGVGGHIYLDWNTAISQIVISSDATVTLEITNIDITYGTSINASITGSLEIQANGHLTLAPGVLQVSFSGALDFGTSCIFEINSNSLAVGGQFTLSVGNAGIDFTWSDNEVNLDFTGSAMLTVTNLYFDAGQLTVEGDSIEIGANGEFDVYVDTVNSEITISSSDSGVSLSVENLDLSYETTLEVSIIGSFDLEANGWLTFGSGVFKAGFSGTLNLGASCEFEINTESITVGGIFSLTSGTGEISFEWANNLFNLSVSGSPALSVTNLYFSAEISEVLEIEADSIGIGANGDLSIGWDSTNDKITIYSDAGLEFLIKNVDVSYGSSFDISIIGQLRVTADGYVSIKPGEIQASFSGALILSDNFAFEINSETIKLEGTFNLQMAEGEMTISWTDVQFYCQIDAETSLNIENLYFEIETLKLDAYRAIIGFSGNGDLKIRSDQGNKEFEVYGDLYFNLENLHAYTKVNSNWVQLCSANRIGIGGGGHVLVDTNSEIDLEFNGQFTITNLVINPPNWNADLSIGSLSLLGNAELNMKKDPASGDGKFKLSAFSGSIDGTISNFDAYVLIGSNDLQIKFDYFDVYGGFTINLDDTHDDIQISASGLLELINLYGEYANFVILADMHAEGDVDITGQWLANPKYIQVTINEPGFFTLLEITYSDITLKLADIELPVGTIKFVWERNDANQEGYFLIDSEISGIPSANMATISWGTKSVSIGWPVIKPGDFRFEWDIPDKFLRFRNGVDNLAPTFTYKDTSTNFELFASSGSLEADYSKAINFIWYEDGSEISGILIDTDGTYLAELIEIGFKKGTSGRKLAVYGISCDSFYIKKDSSNNIEFGGNIYIANHVIFSKLVSGAWKDLDVEWNFQGSEKWIRFDKDPVFDFTLELYYFIIGDYEFSSVVSFLTCDYFELKWTIGVSGKISLDTNGQSMSTITFEIWNSATYDGVQIQISSLKAWDWWVQWTAWPPEEWNLQFGGTIDWWSVDVWVCDNNQWKQIPL